jgi:hypothetical protein
MLKAVLEEIKVWATKKASEDEIHFMLGMRK